MPNYVEFYEIPIAIIQKGLNVISVFEEKC